ncbi:MAG: hypothetical protein DRP87_19675 [Spirochaetes bacterium]|nr:MAG: hypothetical protein DRP87_19675 [Spirochaetota bacterium]
MKKIKRKNLTIEDVATYCGLSRATVSRVLNREKTVRRETFIKVEKAIQELGYTPNVMARALSGGARNTVAILLPDVSIPYYANLLEGADEVAEEKNYHLFMKTGNYNKSVLNLLDQERVDGFIIRNSGDPEVDRSIINKINRYELPFVFIGKPMDENNLSISIDNVGGAREMAHHLADHGYKNILFITGPEKKIDSRDRIYGFKLGLQEKNYDPDAVIYIQGDFTRECGYKIARNFFSQKKVDAVFTGNDQTALGVLHYFYEAHIRVPQDIAVAGFDDAFFSEFLFPPLTTVRQPMYEIGAVAMENIIQRIEGGGVRKSRIILPTQLIVRESCGCKQTQHS